MYEVVEKRDTIIAMFLDWLCNIFDFSPSFQDGVQSGLVYDVGVIGLEQLELGVSCIGIDVLSIRL
jgi:hypothetical protein